MMSSVALSRLPLMIDFVFFTALWALAVLLTGDVVSAFSFLPKPNLFLNPLFSLIVAY